MTATRTTPFLSCVVHLKGFSPFSQPIILQVVSMLKHYEYIQFQNKSYAPQTMIIPFILMEFLDHKKLPKMPR